MSVTLWQDVENEAQIWLDRRFDGIGVDDLEGIVCIICTCDVRPPPAFQDLWKTAGRDIDLRDGRPIVTEEATSDQDALLLVGNPNKQDEVNRLLDIIGNVDSGGYDAPPMILLPHFVAPEKRPQGDSTCVPPEVLERLMKHGLDGVVSGEPVGSRLALEIRAQIVRSANLSRQLNDVLVSCHAQHQHVEYLKECMDFALWEYARVRMASDIPPLDASLPSGVPTALPGFAVGRVLGQSAIHAIYALTEQPYKGSPLQVLRAVPKENYSQVQDIRALSRSVHIRKTLSSDQLRHPNIVQLYEVYHSQTHILFRQEYGGPENLFHRLVERNPRQADRPRRPISLERAVSIITQIVDAVSHMHLAAQICHRDIKPENIFVTDVPERITIKLCDFDLAVVMKDGVACRSQCGTLPFAAPEVLLESRYDGCVSDMWSLGVVLVEVLCGVRVVEQAMGPAPNDADPTIHRNVNVAHAARIRTFFEAPDVARTLVESRCKPELRPLLAVCCPLLSGMLVVDPSQRVAAGMARETVEGLKAHLWPGSAPVEE